MSVITGRDATVTVDGSPYQAKSFTAHVENKVKAVWHSQSAGWPDTAKGVNNWRFSFVLYLDSSGLLATDFVAGQDVALIGTTNNGSGSFSGTGTILDIDWPVAVDGDALEATVNCQGKGAPSVNGSPLT